MRRKHSQKPENCYPTVRQFLCDILRHQFGNHKKMADGFSLVLKYLPKGCLTTCKYSKYLECNSLTFMTTQMMSQLTLVKLFKVKVPKNQLLAKITQKVIFPKIF